MRLLVTGLMVAVALAAAALSAAAGGGGPAQPCVPAETRTALLPAINLTGEDMEETLNDVEMADHVLAALFLERGFQVVEDTAVLAAMAEAAMPVHDRAERTPEKLSAVARATNARLVVSLLLSDKRSSLRTRPFGLHEKEGRAAASAIVWDEVAKAVVCDKVGAGVTDSGADFFAGAVKYSGLREKALQLAVQNALSEFLAPYPVTGSKVDVSARKGYRPAMAEALAAPGAKWDPKQTRVLVLPFLDETKAERRDADSAQVAAEASTCAAQEFAKCGFQMLASGQAATSAKESGIDLADAKARTRDAVRSLGQAAGADVVVTGSFLLSVLDRGSRIVKVEVKVYETASDRYVVAAAGSAGSLSRGRALSGAVYHALKECLAPYRPQEASR